MSSRLIHVFEKSKGFSFSHGSMIAHCGWSIFFGPLTLGSHLCCFRILILWVMNIEQVSLWDAVSFCFEYVPRSGDYSYVEVLRFSFWRNLHTAFNNDHTNLHSYQQYTKVLFSSPSSLNPAIFGPLMTAILTCDVISCGFNLHFPGDYISIFLSIFLAICMSSLRIL